VINTNLPHILYRYQFTADYLLIKFSPAAGECLTLTLSLGVISCQYCHKWYIARNYILGASFLLKKVWCIFNHFYVIRSQKLRNSAK